jgi:hypothetical protein
MLPSDDDRWAELHGRLHHRVRRHEFFSADAALWTLPDPTRAQSHQKPAMWKSVLEGIRYVRRDGDPNCVCAMSASPTLIGPAAMLNICIGRRPVS